MKTNVIVTLQVEGTHYWPDCDIDEVFFLKYPHRHIFHVKAKKEVSHDNRDIEIIQLKHRLELYFSSKNGTFGAMSCEQIAKNLLKTFELNYCSVLEDNENGAEVYV